jgi:hypothetical protein
MSDFNWLSLLLRRLPWLFIETIAGAIGFLSVILVVTILAVRLELSQSWNLYAVRGQAVKAGYPLSLQSVGSAFEASDGEELVVFVGGSAVVELTADNSLLSKELTSRCGRNIRFVNLGSSSQTFSESWDIAALIPESSRRLILIGINPYRLSFDDDDVISNLAHNSSGIPDSFSLLWSIALHTGHIGSLERIFPSIGRQENLGAKWQISDLLVAGHPVNPRPAEDPFQPDRSSYHEPVLTQAEKQRQAFEYIAVRVADFHDRYGSGVGWFNRLAEHFQGSTSDVKFVITPTDPSFDKVDRLISGDMQQAVRLLGGDARVWDFRDLAKTLDTNDFYDIQHMVAKGRRKFHPIFVDAVSRALRCAPDVRP